MTVTLNLDDVLALLEERPYTSGELAELLELPQAVVHAALCASERVGSIKRTGMSFGQQQRWCLPSFQGTAGRRPRVDLVACRAAILASVAKMPKPTQVLVAETGYPVNTVKHLTAQLRDAGKLKSIGHARGAMWALPDWTPPAPTPSGFATSHESEEPEVEPPAFEDDDPSTVPDDIEDTWAPPLRQPVTPKKAQRQAHERPPVATVKTELPWWVTSPRDGFTAAATSQLERMRESKEALKIPLRILQ